jgi:hypothetical protein
MHMTAIATGLIGQGELVSLDRIVLHLRCLHRDHKIRWHLAGVWREVRELIF